MIDLTGGGARAVIDAERGGRLRSLSVDGREFIADFVGESGEHEHWYGGSFPLAPWPGRIPGGSIRDSSTRLPVDSTGNATHGWAADRPWAVEEWDARSVTLSLDLDDRSPWRARVTQRFTFDSRELRMQLAVTSDHDMPCVLGFHPWFPREPGGESPEISLAATTRVLPATDVSFTDRHTTDLGSPPRDDLFLGVSAPPTLTWADGARLVLRSNAPVWVVYEEHPEGICVEPWTGTPNEFARGSSRVTPGGSLSLELAIGW